MTVRPSTFTELPTTLSQAFNSALTAQLQTTQSIQHEFSAIAAEQRAILALPISASIAAATCARIEALVIRTSSLLAATHVYANVCSRLGQTLEELSAKLKGHQPHPPTIVGSATPSTQTTATTAKIADTTLGSAAPSHATPAHNLS